MESFSEHHLLIVNQQLVVQRETRLHTAAVYVQVSETSFKVNPPMGLTQQRVDKQY